MRNIEEFLKSVANIMFAAVLFILALPMQPLLPKAFPNGQISPIDIALTLGVMIHIAFWISDFYSPVVRVCNNEQPG